MDAEHLQHDPKTKHQIKEMLYSYLYSPVEQRYKKQLESLIIQNNQLIKGSHNSFMYKGVYYSVDNSMPPKRMNKLDPSLIPAMDSYLRELRTLNDNEIPYVLGFINQVLNSSNELHDYLRVLPSSIHRPIQEFINTCPCRNKRLTDEEITQLIQKNQTSIDLMKQRMTLNLLNT